MKEVLQSECKHICLWWKEKERYCGPDETGWAVQIGAWEKEMTCWENANFCPTCGLDVRDLHYSEVEQGEDQA